MTDLAFSLFDPSMLLYALAGVVVAFALLFIPSLLVTGAKPDQIARAISCYLWKTFGLILVAMSVTQLMSDLIIRELPEAPLLSALTLLFVVGVGIMIQASRVAADLDHAAVMIPRLVFSHTVEILGGLMALVAGLSLMIGFLVTQQFGGWESSAMMLLLGVTLMLSASLHISHKNRHARKGARRK